MASATATQTCITYGTDLEQFKAAAAPILERDITFNTLALSALADAKQNAQGLVLGLLQCCSCEQYHTSVLISPGFKGGSCQLYIAPALSCKASAEVLAQHLEHLPCTSVCTTAAGAALVLQFCNWRYKMNMNAMVYNLRCKTCINTFTDTATVRSEPERPIQHGSSNYSCATAAATASTAGLEKSKSNHGAFRVCSVDNPADVQLVLRWAAEFLTQVFGYPVPPPAPQMEAMVMPRLQQGLYYVLSDTDDVPVCMASYYPTSASSARVTMLYTPKEFRGRGFGRQTVCELCKQLLARGYEHICLMADQAQPALTRLYQAAGFDVVGDMVILERPTES